MKHFKRRILKKLGLFKVAKRINNYYFEKKYGHISEYNLNVKHLRLTYTTKDNYSKKWFFPRYANNKYHEPSATNLFINEIKPDDCILDIGAHIGFFTCIAARLAFKGTVYAFEVDQKCIPIINENLKLNELKNVVVSNYAVSDNSDIEKIPISTQPNPGLKISTNTEIANYNEVKAIKVDDYIKSRNILPNFIKIDIEGAELKALKGMTHFLKKSNIKILVEVHVPTLKDYFNSNYKEIIELLIANEFQIKEIIAHRSGNSKFRKIDINSKLKGNTMLFCEKFH